MLHFHDLFLGIEQIFLPVTNHQHSGTLQVLFLVHSQLFVAEDAAYMNSLPHNQLFELRVSIQINSFASCYFREQSKMFLEEVYECGNSIEDEIVDDDQCLKHFASSSVRLAVAVELEHQHIGEDSALLWTNCGRLRHPV